MADIATFGIAELWMTPIVIHYCWKEDEISYMMTKKTKIHMIPDEYITKRKENGSRKIVMT